MILYNITVNVNPGVESEWMRWMLEEHIPKVMKTGLFFENKLFRLLNEIPEAEGSTYSIQYFAKNIDDLNEYQNKFSTEIQQEHQEKFKDQFVAFRTYLESVELSS